LRRKFRFFILAMANFPDANRQPFIAAGCSFEYSVRYGSNHRSIPVTYTFIHRRPQPKRLQFFGIML
jgi:hypothetical protein